jgi:recombination protein RecA
MATRKKVVAAPLVKMRPVAKATAVVTKSTRVKIEPDVQPASSYFANTAEKDGLLFVGSGSAVMNAALGGGWVLGRVANIVGDRSSGKTLLAIEACANFHHRYPQGYIRYAEAEAAFDEKYAEALGMPIHAVDFAAGDNAIVTVEDFNNDLVRVMDAHKDKPILYILDSLDALSDEAEQGREITDSSYGGSKPKKMGEMFRRLVQRLEKQNVLLIVVSQLRDKLNVTFGEKQTRSGGRALDFYASHIVWLAETGKIKRTIDKVDRVIGVNVRARVKKNKVGLPFRECAYPIIFGYGVDDLTANVEWLLEVGRDKRLEEVGMSKAGYKVRINNLRDKGGQAVRDVREKLNTMVVEEWQAIETGFLPKSRKY